MVQLSRKQTTTVTVESSESECSVNFAELSKSELSDKWVSSELFTILPYAICPPSVILVCLLSKKSLFKDKKLPNFWATNFLHREFFRIFRNPNFSNRTLRIRTFHLYGIGEHTPTISLAVYKAYKIIDTRDKEAIS